MIWPDTQTLRFTQDHCLFGDVDRDCSPSRLGASTFWKMMRRGSNWRNKTFLLRLRVSMLAEILSVHGLHAVHAAYAAHAVHDQSGKNHRKPIPVAADPKALQTTPAHDAGPTVYSCGIQRKRAALGRGLHKEKRTQHF